MLQEQFLRAVGIIKRHLKKQLKESPSQNTNLCGFELIDGKIQKTKTV